MISSFGDNVRIRVTKETEDAGVAGLEGQVCGQTTPSVTGVYVIGPASDDYAVNVHFEGRGEALWFAPELVELLNHAPGSEIRLTGVDKKWTRTEDGGWHEETLAEKRPVEERDVRDLEPAPRSLEIVVGGVLVAGAVALGRFALLGVPAVLIGQTDASESAAWRAAALVASCLGLIFGWRLLGGSSRRAGGHLFGSVVLYGAALVFAVAGVLGVVAGVLISPFFFAHAATSAGLGLGAWHLAATRGRASDQAGG